MSSPGRRRGAVSFAVLTAMLITPGPDALAGAPRLNDVVAATGDLPPVAALPPVATLPPAPQPLATAGGACANGRTGPARRSRAAARALLCAINRARAQHGRAALGADRRLRRAAGRHARDMVRHHYFAHQRAGGPSLGARLRAAGWHGRAAGEAIAWGCGTSAGAAATVTAWLNSPPHRAILLSPSYRRAGIGLARWAPAPCRRGATWVLDAGG